MQRKFYHFPKTITAKELLLAKKAIIFDFDGTLVDSLQTWEKVDRKFYEKRGIPYNKVEDWDNTMGMSLAASAEFTKNKYNLPESVQDILDEWDRSYRDLIHSDVFLFPHADAFLMQLSQLSIKFGIATAGPRSIFDEFFCKYPETKNLIAAFVSVEDVGKNKPNPAVYIECAHLLKVDIADCAIVEDSVIGLEGAKRAGCVVVCALTSQEERGVKVGLADAFFEGYDELL